MVKDNNASTEQNQCTACESENNEPVTKTFCEISLHPFNDCFCHNLTGREVSNVVVYCMQNFRDCPVYKKRIQQ